METYRIENSRIVKVVETFEIEDPSLEFAKIAMSEHSPVDIEHATLHQEIRV